MYQATVPIKGVLLALVLKGLTASVIGMGFKASLGLSDSHLPSKQYVGAWHAFLYKALSLIAARV